MPEPIQFHTDLYRRDAVEAVAVKYSHRARIDVSESGSHVVANLEPLVRDEDRRSLADEFCNDAFSATARQMRNAPAETQSAEPDQDCEPPWALLAPFGEGTRLALGWAIESLSPVRGGAATLVLAHAEHGPARIAIRRNGGAPLGVAHTDALDFMLMNGGSGGARTEESVGRVLIALALRSPRSPRHRARRDCSRRCSRTRKPKRRRHHATTAPSPRAASPRASTSRSGPSTS